MKIYKAKDGTGYILTPSEERDTKIAPSELREIVVWIKENESEILRDIMCEDCPEVC